MRHQHPFQSAAFFLFSFFFGVLSLAQSVDAAGFPDVPENSIFYGGVTYLQSQNVISGYPDGSFQPEKTINRAEALKMVLLASGQSGSNGASATTFPDVDDTDWFYPYVRSGTALEIVEGYPDGTFKPANNINIAESFKIILLAFDVQLGTVPQVAPYGDVAISDWYSIYAEAIRQKQLFWPMDDGKLHADRDITRGEFAEILYRLMYIREKKLAAFPLSTNWPTFMHPKDHYLVKYPFGWQQITAGNQTILWKQDKENGQLSWARVFPNSASVVIAVDSNTGALTLEEYIGRMEYDAGATTQKLTLNSYPFASITMKEQGMVDYFLELPNKTLLASYTQVGNGLNRTQLSEEIRHIIGSIRYTDLASGTAQQDEEDFLETVRKNILVEGKADATLDLFLDETLIETDSIGIGTGPVDYYYSEEYDVTLKLDRFSKTVLAMNDGKSTAF